MNDILKAIKKTILIPVHPAGFPFIAICAVVMLLFMQISCILGFVGIVLTCWCIYFFRNPVRQTPVKEGLVISPADGTVQMIVESELPPELADAKEDGDKLFETETVTRISVFLNVFNVHINRIPMNGEIKKVVYHPGKFFNADLDKASIHNERSTVLMKPEGKSDSIAFVQIAGLIARRIICQLKAGEKVSAGNIYGLIRFGSRMDIYLPNGVKPLVSVGQTMIGGETVIADYNSSEDTRMAEDRGPKADTSKDEVKEEGEVKTETPETEETKDGDS